jgi:hypothetical protein
MQFFVAELSNLIDQGEFEKSWRTECSGDFFPEVSFVFAGRTISLKLAPAPDGRWPTESVHRTFSSAVRRVNRGCNIRWI